MRYVRSIATAAVLVGAVAGCSSQSTYPRGYAYQSGPYPANAYYASTPSQGYYANGVYYPPATAYSNPSPYATADNYYSSRADYNRNYQGIHGGPERTDGSR